MRAFLRACFLFLLGPLLVSGEAQGAPPDAARLRAALLELQGGRGALATLAVTYDDMHGLHGGLTLTIHGDGRVEQRAVRQKVGHPRPRVSPKDLQQLVALLVEVAAWEQRVPPRPPVPDESQAALRVSVGGERAVIWEWYNDLAKNDRILRVRELMKKIAWR